MGTAVSNEQAANEFHDRVDAEMKNAAEAMRVFVTTDLAGLSPPDRLKQFLNAQQAAVAAFNTCERLVGTSSILGALEDPHWASHVAGTCLNALDSVCQFQEAFVARARSLDLPADVTRPSPAAFCEMQHIVKEHHPERIPELRSRFVSLGLPVMGFDREAPRKQPARIEFHEDGEVSRVEGLTSHDAAKVLTTRTRAKKGDFEMTGAFSGEQAVEVARAVAVAAPAKRDGFLASNLAELKKAPAAVLIRVGAAVLVTLLGWWLWHRFGLEPFRK